MPRLNDHKHRMRIDPTERQKELLTGFFIVGIFVFGFGLGEGALRVLQLAKFGVERSVEKSEVFYVDEKTGLRLPIPGSQHGRIHINSLGFRGPEIAVPKPPATIRLAFLGSSTTYDPYPDDESNWPHLTAARLQEAFSGCRIDYINAGLPGFSSEHMLSRFEHHVAPLTPDIVVILPGDINSDADDLVERKKLHTGTHYEPSLLAEYSLLWSKIEKNVHVIKLQRSAHLTQGKIRFKSRELSQPFARRLTDLVEGALTAAPVVAVATISGQLRRGQSPREQTRAANTALFFMPYMSIPGLLNARDEYNRVIAEVAESESALVIGGHDRIPGDRVHYVDSIHFTPTGSRSMAQRVSEALLRSAEVQALRNRCAHPAG